MLLTGIRIVKSFIIALFLTFFSSAQLFTVYLQPVTALARLCNSKCICIMSFKKFSRLVDCMKLCMYFLVITAQLDLALEY